MDILFNPSVEIYFIDPKASVEICCINPKASVVNIRSPRLALPHGDTRAAGDGRAVHGKAVQADCVCSAPVCQCTTSLVV